MSAVPSAVQRTGAPQADPVLTRLPLQIGTTATWGAGRAAAALFPGLALLGAAVAVCVAMASNLSSGIKIGLAIAALGLMLVIYAIGHLVGAIRNRASDLLLQRQSLVVDGGRLHGLVLPWSELTPPFAQVEETLVRRLTLKIMILAVLSVMAETALIRGMREPVRVWRLHVYHRGQRRLVAESDRPIERDSMAAAASSVGAVVSGQRYVAEAPIVPAQVLACPRCGAPAVPDDAPVVTCPFCQAQIPLPDTVRAQAASTKAAASGRSSTSAIIAKLRDQPRAARANAWLLALSVVMFGAWPIGWGLVAFRVLGDGFQATDVLFLLLPFAAVLAGFFFARGRLADRGALQLLTLGFGALAPRRDGEPSRCRRCQGALPGAGLGGVATCRYCGADNIVGLDLRPSVDHARAEQVNFDGALKQRQKERVLWTTLTVLSGLLLLGWAGATAAYVATMETAPAVAPAPAPAPARPPARPAPRPGNRRP